MVRLIERNVTDGDPEYQEVHVASAQFDELGLWYTSVRKHLESQDDHADKTTEILASLTGADTVTRGKVFYISN
jgi:hypothetical protein